MRKKLLLCDIDCYCACVEGIGCGEETELSFRCAKLDRNRYRARAHLSVWEGYGVMVAYVRACSYYFTEFIKLRSSGSPQNMAALLFHRFAIDCRILNSQQEQKKLTPAHQLKHILDGDLAEEFILNKYAAEHNFSSEHLIRLFRNEFATTPQAYRLQRRLNEARQLLLYSELTVKEIAGMVGFSDQYSFSHSFKAHYGKSPQLFRKEQIV